MNKILYLYSLPSPISGKLLYFPKTSIFSKRNNSLFRSLSYYKLFSPSTMPNPSPQHLNAAPNHPPCVSEEEVPSDEEDHITSQVSRSPPFLFACLTSPSFLAQDCAGGYHFVLLHNSMLYTTLPSFATEPDSLPARDRSDIVSCLAATHFHFVAVLQLLYHWYESIDHPH